MQEVNSSTGLEIETPETPAGDTDAEVIVSDSLIPVVETQETNVKEEVVNVPIAIDVNRELTTGLTETKPECFSCRCRGAV